MPIYITDNAKVTQLTDWRPQKTIEHIIQDIYDWIIKNQQQLQDILQ